MCSWPARRPSARGMVPPLSCANRSKPCAPITSTCTNCTHMTTDEDFAAATAPDGALAAFVEARDQGLVRHIGFSAHSAEIALQLLDYFPFDSVALPRQLGQLLPSRLRPPSRGQGSRAWHRLPSPQSHGPLAPTPRGTPQTLRQMLNNYDPIDEPALAELALRFALSQPITARPAARRGIPL